jgi:acetylornithine deacetylase
MTMALSCKDALGAFDKREVVDIASQSARIKSYSGDEAEIAQWTADFMSDLGLAVSLKEVAPRRFNAIGTWRGRGSGRSFMYNGHMDTNPAGEGWTRDPLGGESDGEFVYGIGICNMKAGNASALHAVSMLKAAGFEPAGDVILAFVHGELQGGVGTVRMLESGVRADYFIVGEPTELTLLTRHSASFVFEITILGKTRHLSKREEGVDAIAAAERLLPRLRALTFSGARSEEDKSLNRINIGVIRGGVSRALFDWRPQQLADVCVLKCAGRFGPSQNLAQAMKDIQALLDDVTRGDPTFNAELRMVEENRIFMPPFQVDHDAVPVRAVEEAHKAVTGKAPKIGMHTPARFFGSDAAHLAKAGMTGLLYGPGGKFNTMPDERVSIGEMEVAAKVYAATMFDIAGAPIQ